MTIILAVATLVLAIVYALELVRSRRLEAEALQHKQNAESARERLEEEMRQARSAVEASAERSRQLIDEHISEMQRETDRVREHYEAEARKIFTEAEDARRELGVLRKYQQLADAEKEVTTLLGNTAAEANALRADALKLLEESRNYTAQERAEAIRRSKEMREDAEERLRKATIEAGQIVESAHKRAEQIAGDAYIALRDKETLERAVRSLWDTVEGYGDRYVVPTRSLIDDLAEDFGHLEAGEKLKSAREHTRRMVELKQAAACNYVEEDRRDRANRFVVDAFNGRVDAILSRTKHDNYGTLEAEIRGAFDLVNLNGIAFRDARILPAYLDARLAELRWAVVAQELKMREREEQRRIAEQMREEEKVRRENERAIKEAQDKEDAIEKALEKARLEQDKASAQEREKFDSQIAELKQKLLEAEAVKQRAISMAQLTRAGTVYVISNIGSFGETVFKIGMTRRREPEERIEELGDASVPFEFDIHAMIRSDDAPSLERLLHVEFDAYRINKVNLRKEFFRIPLERIKEFTVAKGLNATFTMRAEAKEYHESQALEKMSPEERARYQFLQSEGRGEEVSMVSSSRPRLSELSEEGE